MEPKIRAERQDRTVHKATFYEADLHNLVAEAVAEAIGVYADDPAVKIRAYTSSHQATSLDIHRPCVEIEVIVDHTKEPRARRT